MNTEHNYIQLLVSNSRKGRTNSFIELAELFYETVYKLEFQLTADETTAFNLTVETFLTAKNNLSQLSENCSFENWIKQIALIIGYSKSNSAMNQNEKEFEGKENLNSIEKIFFTLPLKNRVICMLHEQLEYNFNEIKESVNIESIEEIANLLNWSKRKLAEKSKYEKIKKLNEKEWSDFAEAFEADRNAAGSEVAPELFSAYLDFKAFNMDIQNIFSNLEIPKAFINSLKTKIFEDSEKKYSQVTKQKNEIQINQLINRDSDKSFKLELDKTEENKNLRNRIIKTAAFMGFLILMAIVIPKLFLNSSNEPWFLSQENNVLVNNLQSRGELFKGDKIVAGKTGSGKITIDDVGYFTFSNEAEFEILTAESNNNSIEIITGKLKINLIPKKNIKNKYSENFYFNIYSKSFEVHSGPLKANMQINKNGKININCIDGWLNCKINNREYYIGRGFEYTNDGSFISPVPFRTNSSEEYRKILFEIDPNNLSIKLISELLFQARNKDALTLLNLLQFLPQREREIVVDRLIEFDKFFTFLGKEKLISLDSNTMEMAFDYLKWDLISSQ